MRRFAWFPILLLLLGSCAEHRAGAPPTRAPATPPTYATGTVVFQTGAAEVPIRVEVADTPEKRALGLMNRRTLAADAGMLFLFPEESVQAFWMHDTYIPLDMVFVNTRREVVGVVENATPRTDTPRSVWKPVRYVIEVNASLTRVNGIGPGTRVRFEGIQSPLLVSP